MPGAVSFKKFGDWAETETIIHRLATEMERAVGVATRRNALVLERAMKKSIQAGVGPRLHPFTVREKGSSKQLVDSGELLNSINHRLLNNWNAVVGLLRNAPHKGARGTAIGIVNLGWLHEHGYQVDVTPKMRVSLARRGLVLSDTTKAIRVPARPFVRPVFENKAIQLQFVEEYRKAFHKLMR